MVKAKERLWWMLSTEAVYPKDTHHEGPTATLLGHLWTVTVKLFSVEKEAQI